MVIFHLIKIFSLKTFLFLFKYDGKVDVETGTVQNSRTKALKRKLMIFVSRIFLEAFTMTFLAEWGDRSQLTTIILAAREVSLFLLKIIFTKCIQFLFLV